ncbi:MAG TPA: hypothetical protein DD412_05955 [Holosporales bacterium]|nr:hypothetical protein [Holosporales bacterium]
MITSIYRIFLNATLLTFACESVSAAVMLSKSPKNITPALDLNLPLSALSLKEAAQKEEASKKITDKITLKLNRDLFEKGLQVETEGYGQYFATLESSNRLDEKFKTTPAKTLLHRKLRESSRAGAMRVGGHVTENSKLYLKVGFESENFGGANTLKTRTVTDSNQGYWRTAMASGVGFQYDVSRKWSISGEASTMAINAPFENTLSAPSTEGTSSKKGKFDSRDNRILVGIHYKFGK